MAYIDREKAIAYVEEQYRLFDNDESKQAIVEGCVEALKFTPTADVEEVKHGEWIHSSRGFDVGAAYECSICHSPSGIKHFYRSSYVFCPDCGAKMDGGKEE